MKALSLWQPWASLIVNGSKSVETRSWSTSYRGPLLIHAAKQWNGELASICTGDPFRQHLAAAGVNFDGPGPGYRAGWNLPFGAVVGRVDVLDCYPVERIKVRSDTNTVVVPAVVGDHKQLRIPPFLNIMPDEAAFGDFSDARFGFLLGNPVRFPRPILLAGRQGLWDVPDDLVARWTQPVASGEEARAG